MQQAILPSNDFEPRILFKAAVQYCLNLPPILNLEFLALKVIITRRLPSCLILLEASGARYRRVARGHLIFASDDAVQF